MPIHIRKATPEEASLIAEFNIAMALETEGKRLDPETIQQGASALFKSPEYGYYLVAELDDAVVGSLMITTEWSDWRNGIFWWIQSVYVVPQARRQGIFTQLYNHVATLAADDAQICGFRLYVEKDNHIAQSVYKSLGMIETDYKLFEQETARS